MTSKTRLPRGVRNHNPGNIRWGDPWQGLVPANKRTDPDFCQFTDPVRGIRAIARTLITYQDKRRAADGSVIDTLAEIIDRWAPPVENDTSSYVTAAVAQTGFSAHDPLDLHDYDDMRPVVEAIIRHENGVGPLKTANTWYSDDVIDQGLKLAGVTPNVKRVGKAPVNKETVGATAAAAVGVVQLAEGIPHIVDALKDAQAHMSTGTTIGVVCGVLALAAGGLIAWSQVRKYQQGLIE